MARHKIVNTPRVTVIEYRLPTVKDLKTSVLWFHTILKSTLKIKKISLEDLSKTPDDETDTY